MFVTTRPYITRGYFTINMLHLSAQISTECKHHSFTALLPDKAQRATLPWLHLYPNHPTLRSCISGDCNISLEHTKLERSDLELHLRIRSTCFFGPWPHLPRTRLPRTRVTHVRARTEVWSQCTESIAATVISTTTRWDFIRQKGSISAYVRSLN